MHDEKIKPYTASRIAERLQEEGALLDASPEMRFLKEKREAEERAGRRSLAEAPIRIFVDFAGIDSSTLLTDAKKAAVKDKIVPTAMAALQVRFAAARPGRERTPHSR